MTSDSKQGPVEVQFNKRVWFDLDEIIQMNQCFFHGCLKHKRDVLRKKNIPEDHFVFVSVTKKGMVMSKPEYSRAKILVSIEWVTNNVTKKQEERQPSQRKDPSVKRKQRKASEPKEQRGLRDAPEPIVLEEHELFRDIEGQVVHVDVRGERNEEGIWFRCSDIEKLFEMEKLNDNITQLDEGLDYEVFLLAHAPYLKGHGPVEQPALRKRRVKAIFLSFNGLMRVIFASHSMVAKRYRDWANRICFAGLFGSDKQRAVAAAEVVGVQNEHLKEVLDICATDVPCVYLFLVGKIVDLKKHFDEFKDRRSGMVFKYGKTNNLLRRCQEHTRTYGSWAGSTFRIAQWVPIHPNEISSAEAMVKDLLKHKQIQFKNHKELVVLAQSDMKEVRQVFRSVFDEYGMSTNEMTKLRHKVKFLENDVQHHLSQALQKDETIEMLNRTISDAMVRETRFLKDKENHEKERSHWIKDNEELKEQYNRARQDWVKERERLLEQLHHSEEERRMLSNVLLKMQLREEQHQW